MVMDITYCPGDRAVRDFTDSLIFVEDNGDPFGSMKFKCVKDTTVNIKIKNKNGYRL